MSFIKCHSTGGRKTDPKHNTVHYVVERGEGKGGKEPLVSLYGLSLYIRLRTKSRQRQAHVQYMNVDGLCRMCPRSVRSPCMRT